MEHRHLNGQNLSRAAIDDIISRGKLADWVELRQAAFNDHLVCEKIEKICSAKVRNPYEQRYHFWFYYLALKKRSGLWAIDQ